MALNPDCVGHETEELVHSYDENDAILYALSVGATRDELDFLYEGLGPKVLPTYAVVPTFQVVGALLNVVDGDLLGVVHGAQGIRLHKSFAPRGTLKTVGKVAAIYDLKRMAQAIFTSETRDEEGELVCETEWNILYRFDGGFDGERPPKSAKARAPDREPDFIVEEATSPEQALLYRLNGDRNPLHADPAIGKQAGFDGPILHGLCTYGYVGRAILKNVCDGDPARLRSLNGQFRKPVFPGDTIITEGWKEEGKVIVRASAKERPGEYVVANSWAEID
ncbi:MAG: MaoC family protein [Deltaproteobacteria bacterium]|nr:MaoC family protein [Deltaproteobacteria bacterium]